MATLPSSLGLTNIADGAPIIASDHRTNYSAVQTALNSLISILAAGTANQVLQSGGATSVSWATPASALNLIFDVVVGRGSGGDPAAPAATIDSNTILGGNIPSTYKHLQLRVSGRGDAVATGVVLLAKLNNDATVGNYYDQSGNASAAATAAFEDNGALAGFRITSLPAASASANHAGTIVADFNDYASTTFFKNFTAVSGFSIGTASGSRNIYYTGGSYLSTSAITRIALSATSGNFVAGTRVTLYGLN